jgi:hypothetical protein
LCFNGRFRNPKTGKPIDCGHFSLFPWECQPVRSATTDFIANLERAEVSRVGKTMAAERGLTFTTAKTGDYVSGTLVGSTQLASGRFAMIDDGFNLVPWQPVLDKRVGQHIAGIMRNQKRGKVGSVKQRLLAELNAFEVASFDRCVERSATDTEHVKCLPDPVSCLRKTESTGINRIVARVLVGASSWHCSVRRIVFV